MPRAVERVGSYYGDQHEELRLKTEYREYIAEKSPDFTEVGQHLKAPSFKRVTY